MLDNAYIIHAESILGQIRGDNVRLLMQMLKPLCASDPEIVRDHDPTDAFIAKIKQPGNVDLSPTNIPAEGGLREAFSPFAPSEMNVRQLSNGFKHLHALSQAGKVGSSSSRRFSLVVEDDTLFTKDVAPLLSRVTSEAPADADIVMISLPAPIGESMRFVEIEKLFRAPPACDAYLVTPTAAEAIAKSFLPVRMATPVQIYFTARRLGLRMYVSTNNVFVDGSKLGSMVSSIAVNNLLVWNQAYCKLLDAVTLAENAESSAIPADPSTDCTNAMAALKAVLEDTVHGKSCMPFGEHADAIALKARALACIGRFAEARESYEKAFEAYEREKAIFNISSSFLRGYMGLFKHLQDK